MKRRTFVLRAVLFGAIAGSVRSAHAIGPLLLWFGRAASLVGRSAATSTVRVAATAGTRRVVSSAVLAARASKASSALRAVTAFTLSTIAVDEVLAQVQGTPEDSVLRWILAYFSVLTQSDSEAAMGMWVEPPDPKHFQHLDRVRPSYRVTRLDQTSPNDARVWVIAQNPGEVQTSHVVDIGWEETGAGKRVSSFRTVT